MTTEVNETGPAPTTQENGTAPQEAPAAPRTLPNAVMQFQANGQEFQGPIVFLCPADPMVRNLYALLNDVKQRLERLEVNQVASKLGSPIRM
jgi:protein tyrosine phosphatase (PTP) superfamily phosphohydrolase (DUF442 family)